MTQTVLISGASGLVGRAVAESLVHDGWAVKRLVRRQSFSPDELSWTPELGLDAKPLEGMDAVVHLAGEPIFGLWTAERMRRIRASRVDGTASLSRALAHCERKPKVMVCASAVGFYGDRGAEVLTEDSPPGEGFLAHACVEWEQAAQPAKDAGIRVVHLRTAIVLSTKGGALKTMLPAFRFGLGGRLGSGKQYFPWITLTDMVRVVRFAMADGSLSGAGLSGAINAAAPQAVTNEEFTRTLAQVLHRPAVFPVPEFALRLLPGNMAREAILASARVTPQRLVEAGFEFEDAELKAALLKTLGTKGK